MKNNNLISKYLLRFSIVLFLSLSLNTYSQITKDSTSVGKISIPNPISIVDAYKYDPITDRYIFSSTFSGFDISFPIILTTKQYEELVLRESMKKYYKDKLSALNDNKEGSAEAQRNLLPKYYVNSKLFESIFGSNSIDIKPTGSVEMDLGLRYTKQDNPALSPRNRVNTTFDFNQRISLGLQGKVGTRLNVNVNYDTQSTFAFQNLIKLSFDPAINGNEDSIIQNIEIGNVSLPINSTLIRGAQSLFGVKAKFQFGKTSLTTVFSEQKSQTKTVSAEGGATIQEFALFAQEYDNDRHYFLSQYFRNNYNKALANYPFIDSRAQITRIEVWVTNRQNRVNAQDNNLRNIIAIQDLGEAQLTGIADSEIVGTDPAGLFNVVPDAPSDNGNNKFNPLDINEPTSYLNSNIRDIATAGSGFNNPNMTEGVDYVKLENARKLGTNEFTFHPQLGYISLNQRLANDEVLAVSYQYTVGGEVYQVGEFGTDGIDATVVDNTGTIATPTTQSLILKMLKGTLVNVNEPVWDLMMKNIYSIPGGNQLEPADFRFNILYTDPSPLNYITEANTTSPLPNGVAETPLIKVFNLDKLNYTNDPQQGGDGFFDFVPGITIDSQFGRIIFTNVEPFGKLLFDKLKVAPTEDYDAPPTGGANGTYNDNQAKYVFRNLYKQTQAAALQESEKNKFQLKGRYKTTNGDGIPIGAFNVPQGSVVVTAGGRVLVEGVDYTVNYQIGRVYITDNSLLASNTPISVSLENNTVFGQQTRRFWGFNIEHKFNEKFTVSGTFLKMTERPFTTKTDYNQESVNNSIYGINVNFATEVPFLTRLANKLPNIDTDVPSNLSFRGEFAYLQPGAPKASEFNGEATVYIDDFEGTQTAIDLRSANSWSLASTPDGFGADQNGIEYGFKRAKLAWYSVDPVFYTQTPTGVSANDLSSNRTRRVFIDELYPVTDIPQGQTQVVTTLDMSYYPKERGPYNYNSQAINNTFPAGTQQENFGGIMRSINTTNFEQSNVEYLQFWVMDPYYGVNGDNISPSNNGKLVINLGEISEDVLKDGRKNYENGLPDANGQTATIPSIWGKVPASQSLIYAFDSDQANRTVQDVGFDGLSDNQEATLAGINPAFASLSDPAADNYEFYFGANGNVLERYKNYNGTQGNSPITITDNNRGSTTSPDVEDINRDNTMNTIDAYYKYEVTIAPNPIPGENFVVDTRIAPTSDLPNGGQISARWILYKIPILELATPANAVGSIQDLRSVRFMRMFMTGFSEDITLRFGALDLVRGEWRRFTNTLDFDDQVVSDDDTGFDVVAVNVQENGNKSPIPYVVPPGVIREQLNQNNTIINQNEQSLSLRVYKRTAQTGFGGLEPKDSRAVFKNVNVDMRQFKRLRMFLHAEALPDIESPALQDDEMVAFIRFGNDFTQNFYQVEIPLKVTAQNATSPDDIWLADNEINLPLDLLTKLKILSLGGDPLIQYDANGIGYVDEQDLNSPNSRLRIGIKGNPNFGLVRTLMIGVKNSSTATNGDPIRGEVWFNELRMSEMDNKGGYATVANLDTNMADFATISATGRLSTIGFGSLEQGPNERSREDVKQYDIVTNFNLGQLMPKKWGVNLPFNYAVGEEIITPKYDPFYQDLILNDLLDITSDPEERANYKERAIDYTKRQSINFIGVKKEKAADKKQHIYDVENLTLSYSYNETNHHDYEVQSLRDQQVKTTVDYAFAFKPLNIEPFKKTKFLSKSKYFDLLREFNFNFLPTSISFSSNIIRQFNRQQFRQVEVQGLQLDPLSRRNYFFNYQYGANYKLTKSLSINYNASSNNLVQNYLDENSLPIESFSVWNNFWDAGIANQHNQQLVLNYDLPINKIPLLSFVKSTYSYTSNYNWNRNPYANVPIDGEIVQIGNTIQNANSHKLNTDLSMDLFYKYLGIGVKKNKKAKPAATPKPGEKITAKPVVNTNSQNKLAKVFIDLLTSVKKIQINYNQTSGTVLPGYLPGLGFWGTTRPSLGFVLGSQSDIRYEAAKNGWLTGFQGFNQNYTQVVDKQLNFTAQMELFKDFKIDVSADTKLAQNYSEQYDVSSDGTYNPRSPYNFGNYNISTILIKTAFSQSDENFSQAFQDFRENRLVIANRLAIANGIDLSNPSSIDAEGYPVGYGKNSQQVLLPSFLAAYSGQNANKVSTNDFKSIPLPNWVIKYTGLMNNKWFKDKFKRFSIQHGYRSSYGINAFRSNLNPLPTDQNGNFFAKRIISNVNLAEQFNPLAKVEFETKSALRFSAEIKRDRTLNLSFDNNLLTEVKGNDYTLGLGYRIKNVTFNSALAGNTTGVLKSDINIKADFTIRKNNTIVRYLDYDNNQLAGGQNLLSVKLTADYALSKNFTTIFYYDHQFSQAVISTAFPLTTIRSGFTLRYNFGN